MIKTSYQVPELRNTNDEVVQEGAFGKNTALSNSDNTGWIDYVMNDLEALHDTIGDSAATLDGNGHVVEPANLAIGDEDGVRLKTGYVKTSGGTVNGTLNVAQNLKMQDNQENVFGGMYVPASSATSQFLQIYGGETPSNNGGNLQLPSDGSWTLQAKNGTTAYNLVGGTDGTLKWRGNNVAVTASPAFTGNPTAPTQAASDNSTKLATTAFVKNNFLKLSGGTLTGDVEVRKNSTPLYKLTNGNLTRGVTPSSNTTVGGVYFNDSDGKCFGAIFPTVMTGGQTALQLIAYQNKALAYSVGVSLINYLDNTYAFSPSSSNTVVLGEANRLWKQLYAGTTTISTSDERLKDNITAIPDAVLDAWGEINWYQYQFKDSIEEKGETKARIHTGAIAQRIESVFDAHGLDANKYGLLCYDEWKSEPAERDEDGNITQEARSAGNRYSLRYEEALCMEAAYQRRRADRLEERIARLEALISE